MNGTERGKQAKSMIDVYISVSRPGQPVPGAGLVCRGAIVRMRGHTTEVQQGGAVCSSVQVADSRTGHVTADDGRLLHLSVTNLVMTVCFRACVGGFFNGPLFEHRSKELFSHL